ncbi:M20/M25/M40 family metallo-hydrolase [Nibrella viscosa]|uniref:M20/M25/M40 family metallo-hydrolase n=1 Tax=Nibrella viscosa TaxID=1084524 RepID=A0ABP8K4U1_9BACT
MTYSKQTFLYTAALAATLLTGTLPAWAQDALNQIPAEARTVVQTVRPEAIRAHMGFLADDALEGRRPGTRGFALAANYLQAQFEALGLLPAGDNKTYRQAVPLRRAQVNEAGSSFAIVRKGSEQPLEYGRGFVLSPNFGKATSEVTAPVVFVGFGITAPELSHDDYDKIDVKGKIVAYFNGAPTNFPSNQRAYYSSTSKLENAVAHGAVGVISCSIPTDLRTRMEATATRLRQSQGVTRWVDKQGQAQRTNPELLGVATVSDSTARALFAGAGRSFDDAVGWATRNTPQAFPLSVSVRMRTQTTTMPDIRGENVVAVLPGTDPVLKNEYVVHVAHLDHLGIGKPVNGDSIYNGAHDNASGVGILLETARLYTSLPNRPRRSILFVGVTGEELGLLGSDYFAGNPTMPGSMVANFSLDMPFFFHPLLDIVPYGVEHSSLSQPVGIAAAALGVDIAEDPIPEQTVFMRSDHFSFVRQGIPALFIKSGFKTGNPQLDGRKVNLDWRGTIYHSPQDDMNQPFDFQAAAKHVQLQFLTSYLVAQADTRPVWNKGDFFGNKFGKKKDVK